MSIKIIVLAVCTFVLCASLIDLVSCQKKQDSKCECEEESNNGQYCAKWECDIDPEKCFPSDVFVVVHSENGNGDIDAIIPIEELQIGDCVIDTPDHSHCSPVIMISHRIFDIEAEFLEIITENDIKSYATPNHIIPMVDSINDSTIGSINDDYISYNPTNFEYKMLTDVYVGEYIWTRHGIQQIKRINPVWKRGINEIHTESGHVMVGDILFSSYSTVDHHFAHTFFGIYNTFRSYGGFEKDTNMFEQGVINMMKYWV